MKKNVGIIRVIMLIVAGVCIVVFVPWSGVRAWLSPLPESVQEQVQKAPGYNLDGIIVYVDRAGEEHRRYAAGWKNRAAGEPADPDALFKIASISKLYLAVATVKAVDQGLLSLDDSLRDLLPEVANRIQNSGEITLRMLVQHRTGIPDFIGQDGFSWAERQSDINDNLQLALDLEADFEPDEQYRYSNTNYLLLSLILDSVTEAGHWDYISREILAPLGLQNTYKDISQVDIEAVASGYHYISDDDLKSMVYMTPGGGIISTAQEVGIFLRALNTGSLLTEDERTIYDSVYEYSHTGWVPGYQSIARYHEDLDAVVIQFVSSTGGTSEMVSRIVYRKILRIVERDS